ncbi:MAG TPA: hypothetical protein VFT91_09695 [Dehalococcoidia bacterium]|nr:hypothetical protein [Dehalococcoidia bacterium]
MTTVADYGALFREAYAVLHGGGPGEAGADAGQRRAGESLEEYLSGSRGEALGRLQRRLSAAAPPEALKPAHALLLRLLASGGEADAALAAQVEAYRCGQFPESIAQSERLQALVTESARLDRELIASLREAEGRSPGTLAILGIEGIAEPREGGGRS